jgi:tetratricopeptide (TPR) repeat protein
MDYHKLFDLLLLQRRLTGPIRNAEELSILKSNYEKAFSKPPSPGQSLDAQFYFLLARVEYARIAQDKEQSRTYSNELFNLFEKNEARIDHYIQPYVYLLNVFIVQRLYTGRTEADAALSRLGTISERIHPKVYTNEVKVKVWEIYYTCLTDIAIAFRDYEYALSYIDAIKSDLKKYERHMTPSFKLVLWSNIACVYFGAGNYKQALKWSHEVINDAPEYREDIFYITRILYVLIHLELGNQLILPNLLQSLYRYLYKKNRVYQFESIFFKYLRLFLRADTKKEQRKLLKDFREELEPLQNNSFENLIFGDIDLIGWIDRKLKNNNS